MGRMHHRLQRLCPTVGFQWLPSPLPLLPLTQVVLWQLPQLPLLKQQYQQ